MADCSAAQRLVKLVAATALVLGGMTTACDLSSDPKYAGDASLEPDAATDASARDGASASDGASAPDASAPVDATQG